jgi:DNA-directed RNA polymerase subunit K/omega
VLRYLVDMEEAMHSPESVETSVIPPEPAPPIHSRFLFVDVAALRAKQLRRGARVRFETEQPAPALHKPERLAMEEVRRGLVWYDIPAKKPREEAGA